MLPSRRAHGPGGARCRGSDAQRRQRVPRAAAATDADADGSKRRQAGAHDDHASRPRRPSPTSPATRAAASEIAAVVIQEVRTDAVRVAELRARRPQGARLRRPRDPHCGEAGPAQVREDRSGAGRLPWAGDDPLHRDPGREHPGRRGTPTARVRRHYNQAPLRAPRQRGGRSWLTENGEHRASRGMTVARLRARRSPVAPNTRPDGSDNPAGRREEPARRRRRDEAVTR